MPGRPHLRTNGLPPFRHHPDMGCREADPLDIMVPPGYADHEVNAARAVCEPCPIWRTCLAWALEHDPDHGVYAGTTPDQRRRINDRIDEWPTAPIPPKKRRDRDGPRRPYRSRAGLPDRAPLFDAARAYAAGMDRDVVLAEFGLSKSALNRTVRILRFAPELVDEVLALRMTLAGAHTVAQERDRAKAKVAA